MTATGVAAAWTSLPRRFWSKVDRSGDCWLWTGSRTSGGYGRFRVGSRSDGSRGLVPAGRVAWGLVNGPVPAGMLVLHRGDNPPCVRPDHLFVGTALDNSDDMIAKGRARHPSMAGERCGHAKLTPESVAAIRARHAAGEQQRRLADEYGISRATVCLVVNGRRWAA